MEKLVLAYSGGLDTSYIVKKFSDEKKYEVYTVLVNTGGFSEDELKKVSERALKLGAKEHKNIDITGDYYQKCIRYMVYGNILKNNAYPLSVSSERTFQAIEIAKYAKEIGAKYIAHGSTGAGNDQVRFDLTFRLIIPDVEIITPVRDEKLSRESEIEYLRSAGIDEDWKKSAYSINKGIWGTSIGGQETLSSNKTLPEHAYLNQLQNQDAYKLKLGFQKGELHTINNKEYENTVDAIQYLNELGGRYALGRGMHVGDTIIGSKGRVGFEAPAAILIIEAHRMLEKHVLSKWQMYWKDQLANWYGMLLHEAQYFEPVMRNIEKFLEDSQERVSGEVFLTLFPYRFEIEGIESKYDLANAKFGSYGEENTLWTGEDVKGFTKILANSMMMHQALER